VPLYLILGWSGLILLPRLFLAGIDFPLFILGGGIVYSLGVIPFLIKRGPAHFIWHFFVLLGAAVHWCGIFLNVYLG
jgi:hemolysin III